MSVARLASQSKADKLLVGLFLVLGCSPLTKTIVGPRATVLAAEARQAAPLPLLGWRIAAILNFPIQFDAFFNDGFGFRNLLQRFLAAAKMECLGVSASPGVTIGSDGWLFTSEMPGGADFAAPRPFTPDELARWRRLLENRRDWLAERGIRYVVAPLPTKQSIYAEFLPKPLARQLATGSRREQLIRYLREHSTLEVVDLMPPLLDAKKHERIFDRTDSHWNDRGAYAGSRGILKAVGIDPQPREMFKDIAVPSEGGDLARMLGMKEAMQEEQLLLEPRSLPKARILGNHPNASSGPMPLATELPDPGLTRTVFFCDSFAVRMQPFLSEHFARILYHWQMTYPIFQTDVIEHERPDVVFQAFVERKLVFPVPEVTDADPFAGQFESWTSAKR